VGGGARKQSKVSAGDVKRHFIPHSEIIQGTVSKIQHRLKPGFKPAIGNESKHSATPEGVQLHPVESGRAVAFAV
jgi:hypothetical protein